MSYSKLFVGILLFSAWTVAISSEDSASNGITVYEFLPEFGLPSGLFPDSVKSFSFSNNGSFIIELEKPCYVHFDYLVYYSKRISGVLKYGSITNLKGVQVRRFLFWFDVHDIRVDLPPSDSIYFHVGWINKKLDVKQFMTVHSCEDEALSRVSWKDLLKVSEPSNEITMLITE